MIKLSKNGDATSLPKQANYPFPGNIQAQAGYQEEIPY